MSIPLLTPIMRTHAVLVAGILVAGSLHAQPLAPPGIPDPTYAPGFFSTIVGEWSATGCAAPGGLQYAVGNTPYISGVGFCSAARITYGFAPSLLGGQGAWAGWLDIAHTTDPLVGRLDIDTEALYPQMLWGHPACANGFSCVSTFGNLTPFIDITSDTWLAIQDLFVPGPEQAVPLSTTIYYAYRPWNWQAFCAEDPVNCVAWNGYERGFTATFSPIPEPSTVILLATGLLGVAMIRRRRA